MIQEAIIKVKELQAAAGSNQKQEILKRYKDDEDFCKLLYYALNPMLTYKISERTMNQPAQYNPAITLVLCDIYTVCDTLSARKALDDATIYQVCAFLQMEVQQAYPIDEYPLKAGVWFTLTQKLNGVRATFYKGKLYARSGVPYKGLDHITDILSGNEVFLGLVFDGELTLMDKGDLSDNEAFRKATGIINSDDVDKTTICYTIFDVINAPEFEADQCVMTYKARRTTLEAVSGLLPSDCHVRVLPVLYMGTDQSKIDELLDQMVAEDKEGLIVNLDVPYQRKRHRGILKVKRFYTMDLPIIGWERGTGRLSETLGAFVLEYKGAEVKVGSGFTNEQRAHFWEHREELLGTLCEVKYKEISYDKKTGAESLQFPIFVTLRTDKNDVSYG